MDQLQFGRLWLETQHVVRRHAELMLPVIGLFLFVPQLLLGRVIGNRAPADMFAGPDLLPDLLILSSVLLCGIVGQLTLYRIAWHDGMTGETLGMVLRRSVGLLAPAVAITILQGMAIGLGLLLLILPGLWLMARFIVALPLLAAGQQRDPVAMLQQSWAVTRGHSFRVLGMLSFFIIGFLLLSIVFGGLAAALGLLTTMVAGLPSADSSGWGAGRWLFELVSTGLTSLFALYYICFAARLGRALAT